MTWVDVLGGAVFACWLLVESVGFGVAMFQRAWR